MLHYASQQRPKKTSSAVFGGRALDQTLISHTNPTQDSNSDRHTPCGIPLLAVLFWTKPSITQSPQYLQPDWSNRGGVTLFKQRSRYITVKKTPHWFRVNKRRRLRDGLTSPERVFFFYSMLAFHSREFNIASSLTYNAAFGTTGIFPTWQITLQRCVKAELWLPGFSETCRLINLTSLSLWRRTEHSLKETLTLSKVKKVTTTQMSIYCLEQHRKSFKRNPLYLAQCLSSFQWM